MTKVVTPRSPNNGAAGKAAPHLVQSSKLTAENNNSVVSVEEGEDDDY